MSNRYITNKDEKKERKQMYGREWRYKIQALLYTGVTNYKLGLVVEPVVRDNDPVVRVTHSVCNT
jgi:hypothetical protein